MALRGGREVRARLRAIKQIFKPVGREWADLTVIEAKRRVPVRTGKTRNSIRRRNASQRKATVVGFFPVNFIDAGTKEHDIRPRKVSTLKFEAGGQTVFARKVHKRRQNPRPFKQEAAEAGLRQVPLAKRLIDLWNKAA